MPRANCLALINALRMGYCPQIMGSEFRFYGWFEGPGEHVGQSCWFCVSICELPWLCRKLWSPISRAPASQAAKVPCQQGAFVVDPRSPVSLCFQQISRVVLLKITHVVSNQMPGSSLRQSSCEMHHVQTTKKQIKTMNNFCHTRRAFICSSPLQKKVPMIPLKPAEGNQHYS